MSRISLRSTNLDLLTHLPHLSQHLRKHIRIPRMYAYLRVRVCVCVYVYVRYHTYVQVYVRMYIHAYIRTNP